jgi:hypothetical protein
MNPDNVSVAGVYTRNRHLFCTYLGKGRHCPLNTHYFRGGEILRVYILNDKIIDALENKVLKSGYFIFKEAVRYCNKQGWKWFYANGRRLIHGRELWDTFGRVLAPSMPEQYLFSRDLHAQIYDVLVKESSSHVPRPYITTKKVMHRLFKRGDGEFFGIWFVYHHSGVYYCVGNNRAKLVWKPEISFSNNIIEQAN